MFCRPRALEGMAVHFSRQEEAILFSWPFETLGQRTLPKGGMMITRRDLIKMGILSSGGYVLLPPGGGFGRVASFFSANQFGSPKLTPFVDPLPAPGLDPTLGGFVPLTEAAQFPITTIAPYARPYYGVNTFNEKGTRCFEISAVERTGSVKFHRDVPAAPPIWP